MAPSRRSPSSTSLPAAADVADALEARLTLEENDDFSLIHPPSTVSSLEQLSARGSRSGGESFLGSSRRASSLPGSFQGGGGAADFLDTPRGSRSPQPAVYIDDTRAKTLCLGTIGSSGRFCVALKARGLTHCGTVAHARSKFRVRYGCFYVPAGALLGKASAKQHPALGRDAIPGAMLPIFETGNMSAARWEETFQEAIRKGPSTPPRSSVRRDASPIDEMGGDESVQVDDVVSTGSVLSVASYLDVDSLEVGGVGDGEPLAWTHQVDDSRTIAELSQVVREQQDALSKLWGVVGNLAANVPKVVDKLNTQYRPILRSHSQTIRSTRDKTEALEAQVCSVCRLVAEHDALSTTINEAMEGNATSLAAINSLEEALQTFADELAECSERTDLSKAELLSLINRVSAVSTKRSSNFDRRLTMVEAGLGGMPPGTRGPGAMASLTPDTSFGLARVGNADVDVTMNVMISRMQTLESRLQAVADRTQSAGVVFHRLAFASEADFGYWYMTHNPPGDGPAAFVDMISIWSFATSESGATEWLVDLHRSQSVGFRSSPDTRYAHSMTTRYPQTFVGKVDTILSSHTIKMLESVDAWRGNGMGDGYKERLLGQLQYAVQSHTSYCEDYLPDGPVRQAALRTAQVTQHFLQTLLAYLDDELTMLTSFNLPPKQTLLLLSNQVVHICDDLFEFRNQAKGVDVSNRVSSATRYAWVTLQALGCMDNYLRDKFRKHPGINSTYMRFLTRNLADQSSMGLKTKMEAAVTKLTKLEGTVTAAATKAALEKLDGKLELVIRANSLKRTAG